MRYEHTALASQFGIRDDGVPDLNDAGAERIIKIARGFSGPLSARHKGLGDSGDVDFGAPFGAPRCTRGKVFTL